ncbi:MAG: ATP-binding cassette domain-containing protein [Clostridium butyricum]|nr:ATP-binding cassette domain-containing protein [Clostridium butyricum]
MQSSSLNELKVKNINFAYDDKDKLILSNVNLNIKSNEIVGLVGPSGIGKSTLAKIIAGYITPKEGNILINNAQVKSSKEGSPIQLIYQHPEKAVNPKWKMRKILNEWYTPDISMIQSFGIEEEWMNRWPAELSGGELQRFCILRALSPKTKFLIADEISTMLDAITQAQIWEMLLKAAKEKNIGILVVSHNDRLLEKICTRTVEFKNINFS